MNHQWLFRSAHKMGYSTITAFEFIGIMYSILGNSEQWIKQSKQGKAYEKKNNKNTHEFDDICIGEMEDNVIGKYVKRAVLFAYFSAVNYKQIFESICAVCRCHSTPKIGWFVCWGLQHRRIFWGASKTTNKFSLRVRLYIPLLFIKVICTWRTSVAVPFAPYTIHASIQKQ